MERRTVVAVTMFAVAAIGALVLFYAFWTPLQLAPDELALKSNLLKPPPPPPWYGRISDPAPIGRMRRQWHPQNVSMVAFPFSKLTANGKRKIRCKTDANAQSCYWTRGRLSCYNGSPAYRIWKVGTHRVLGIYSGPSLDRYSADNEYPEFPANIKRVFKPTKNRIFADFEVCPLEVEQRGAMQSACIDAAKNVFVENFE